MNKIAIISCYFGNFPWYFPYFLHSCKFNPDVDFIIITDNSQKIKSIPENVHFIKKNLKDIEDLASEKLGFKSCIPYPYKLCDFKPTYGYIFSEILKEYEFWGHGDIDLLYGNIRKFMTNEILEKYDIISMRHDYITGTLALFRNEDRFNTLFRESRDFEKVFTEPTHFCFDECNFLWEQLENGIPIFELNCEIDSMTHVVKRLEKKGDLNAHFDFLIVEGTPGQIKWKNGEIIYKNKFEAMLYHLIRFKTVCEKPIIFREMPDTIYFSRSRIYK